MRSKLLVVVALVVFSVSSPVWAQSLTSAEVLFELKKLRSELDQARAELQRLRADLDQLKPAAQAEPPPIPPIIEMLQAQVAEQAQTKVESASRMPLKIFGTIHSSMAVNSGEANWLENPNIVAPEPASTGSFSSTLRQTRLGIRAEGLELGAWRGSGAVVFDFFGGTPGFQTGPVMGLPRLLYAFARFERGAAAIHVGQDDMMLAPRNPTSVAAFAFPLLFRSGNLYLRAPQARIESRLAGAEGSELRASFGIVSPIGGDYRSTEYTFVPPALGGERSKMPAFQGRVAWQQGTEDRGTSVGFSAHYGRERPALETVDSWATAVDFNVQGERVGVAGEAFVGDNVDQFGGALGQVARSAGGFLEARLRPVARWDVVFGGGSDKPRDTVALLRNTSAYASLTFRPLPEVATSFEYRWLETRAGIVKRRNHHLNWALVYGF